MSSPKDPKPEDARRASSALEHTFLGVAPTAPQAPVPGQGGAAGSGAAIIAAPMISVSGDRAQRAAQPAVAAPAPAAPSPLARTSLQGGWQSSAMPRPTHPDPTALQGTPGGWAPPAPAASPAAPRPAQPPRPQVQRQEFLPRQVVPGQPAPHPTASADLQHTALASDYLRVAREAAFGAGAPAAPRPNAGATPRPPQQEAFAPRHAPQPQASAQQHAPQRQPQAFAQLYPAHYEPPRHIPEPPPTQPPLDIPVNLAESFVGRAVLPPSTVGPAATAELLQQSALPIQAPVVAPPIFMADPEAHGPDSFGTQASVALPLNDAAVSMLSPTPARPAAATPPMAAAASPVRGLPPQPSPMAGTMLERTPSIPGRALQQHPAPPAPAATHSAHAGQATRFEQVPSARGSLQATGFGLQIPIDQSAADWGRGSTEPAANLRRKEKPPSQLRMILLAVLALAAVGFATYGKQLFPAKSRSPTDGIEGPVARRTAREPDQATLTNRPSSAAAPARAAGEPSAVAAGPAAAAAAPTPAPATAAPAEPAPPVEPVAPANDKAAAEAGKAAEAAATPESRLAAQAGRHVIAARYAEALPLYRELQRSYPQNTAYAAMAKVLDQKTAAKPSTAKP